MQPARSSHHFENSFEKKNRFETAELGSWASLRRPRSGRQSQVLQSSRLSCGPATTIPGARQDPSSPDSPEAPDHAYPLRLREAPPPASGETGAGRAERLVAPARRPRGAASLLSKRLAGTVGGRAVAVWSAGQQRAPSSLGLAVAPQLSREQRRKSWPSSSVSPPPAGQRAGTAEASGPGGPAGPEAGAGGGGRLCSSARLAGESNLGALLLGEREAQVLPGLPRAAPLHQQPCGKLRIPQAAQPGRPAPPRAVEPSAL